MHGLVWSLIKVHYGIKKSVALGNMFKLPLMLR